MEDEPGCFGCHAEERSGEASGREGKIPTPHQMLRLRLSMTA